MLGIREDRGDFEHSHGQGDLLEFKVCIRMVILVAWLLVPDWLVDARGQRIA